MGSERAHRRVPTSEWLNQVGIKEPRTHTNLDDVANPVNVKPQDG